MKNKLLYTGIGFILFPVLFFVTVTIAYGPGPIAFLTWFVAGSETQDGEDPTADYYTREQHPMTTDARFIKEPGVTVHFGGSTLYRYEPIINFRDGPDFETCFAVTDIKTDILDNYLGLRVFLAPEDKSKLLASLGSDEDSIFVIEQQETITRFVTFAENSPSEAYRVQLENDPSAADFTVIAHWSQIENLVGFASFLTPGRKPPACTGEDDLYTIKHWDILMDRHFPER